MENEKCKITLDNPTSTYFSGQTINGVITLIGNKEKKIRGIYFKISGYGKCSWSTILSRDSSIQSPNNTNDASFNKDQRDKSIQFSGNEEYLNSTVYLAGSKNGPAFEVPEGRNSYNFSFQLKHLLPSTFKGSYGKIKYKMEFIIDKPWKFDEKYEIPIIIKKSLNLNLECAYANQPQQKQITRNIGYFGSGPISLHILIPRTGYVPGEKLPLQVVVSNNSSTNVDKVKFAVRKIIDYNSITPSRVTKQEIVKIMKKEAGGVDKKCEQKYEHMLDIPDLPSTDNSASKIINIKYEIKVEGKISGLYKNLIETIPFTIATVPIHGYQPTQPMPMPSMMIPMPVTEFNSLPVNAAGQGFISMPPLPINASSPIPNQFRRSTNLPTAPPLDFISVSPNSTRSSICSQWDAPPTYDDVFGSPTQSNDLSTSMQSEKSGLSYDSLSSSRFSQNLENMLPNVPTSNLSDSYSSLAHSVDRTIDRSNILEDSTRSSLSALNLNECRLAAP